MTPTTTNSQAPVVILGSTVPEWLIGLAIGFAVAYFFTKGPDLGEYEYVEDE